MKYRVITYRSRKLKHSVISFEDIGTDASEPMSDFDENEVEEEDEEEEVRLSRRERRAQKKQLKKQQKEDAKKFRVGDEEYNEDDFDPEDVEDMRASDLMNRDGFYDPLEPIDSGEEHVKTQNNSSKTVAIIAAAIIVTVVVIIASFVFMLKVA